MPTVISSAPLSSPLYPTHLNISQFHLFASLPSSLTSRPHVLPSGPFTWMPGCIPASSSYFIPWKSTLSKPTRSCVWAQDWPCHCTLQMALETIRPCVTKAAFHKVLQKPPHPTNLASASLHVTNRQYQTEVCGCHPHRSLLSLGLSLLLALCLTSFHPFTP